MRADFLNSDSFFKNERELDVERSNHLPAEFTHASTGRDTLIHPADALIRL